jgi:RNA polymerase sigma-70 factor (ECF subfamily)
LCRRWNRREPFGVHGGIQGKQRELCLARMSRGGRVADPFPADPALIRAIQSDDLQAFETFYRRFETSVYRTSLALVADEMTAEEVVTETFLRAHAARARLDPERCPLPWLQRVAVNLSINHLRRRRLGLEQLQQVETWSADRGSSPEAAAEDRETAIALARGIDRLPDRLRAVVVLRFVQELSLAEISEVLECPVGTVKSRLHHGLRLLRADLSGEQAGAGFVPGRVRVPAAAEVPRG